MGRLPPPEGLRARRSIARLRFSTSGSRDASAVCSVPGAVLGAVLATCWPHASVINGYPCNNKPTCETSTAESDVSHIYGFHSGRCERASARGILQLAGRARHFRRRPPLVGYAGWRPALALVVLLLRRLRVASPRLELSPKSARFPYPSRKTTRFGRQFANGRAAESRPFGISHF